MNGKQGENSKTRSYQKVWRLWEKGTEKEKEEGESGCKEDEEGGGEGEDEDVGGEDAEADGQRVDHGQGCSGLELVAIWMQTRFVSHGWRRDRGNLDGGDLDGENLDGGDLADEDEGHHDTEAKAEAAETSSTSK